jgi:2-hydroxylaminobenzoate mutase
MSGQDGLPTGKHKPALMTAVGALIAFIGDQPLDEELEARLNDHYGPTTGRFLEIQRLIRVGIEEGWAGYTQVDGPDYCRGRLANASPETRDFVLESARLRDVRGQYHRHPLGEINMIQPVDPAGKFCGHGAGWKVFAPDTSHYPTVTGGTVTFLFLLPKGLIEYKAAPIGAT